MDGPWNKVILQRYTETRTASGHATKSYVTWQTVWVKFRTLSGNERLRAQQVNATLTHEVSMTYGDSIVPHVDYRIVWGTRTFDIKDVRNVDEMNTEIRMLVSEVQTAGPVSSGSPSSSASSSESASISASPSASPSSSASA